MPDLRFEPGNQNPRGFNEIIMLLISYFKVIITDITYNGKQIIISIRETKHYEELVATIERITGWIKSDNNDQRN